MDLEIYNISNIRTKKLNEKMQDFLRYMAKTNNTSGKELNERFNITKKTRYDRIKKLENLKILEGLRYVWGYKALGYRKEVFMFLEGTENKDLIDTGIIMEIRKFKEDNTSFVHAILYDEGEEQDLKKALEDKNIILYKDRLL